MHSALRSDAVSKRMAPIRWVCGGPRGGFAPRFECRDPVLARSDRRPGPFTRVREAMRVEVNHFKEIGRTIAQALWFNGRGKVARQW